MKIKFTNALVKTPQCVDFKFKTGFSWWFTYLRGVLYLFYTLLISVGCVHGIWTWKVSRTAIIIIFCSLIFFNWFGVIFILNCVFSLFQRIHFETSSVLIRQMPKELVKKPLGWKDGPLTGKLLASTFFPICFFFCSLFMTGRYSLGGSIFTRD